MDQVVVRLLGEGVLELQQAGADAAPVVSAEHLLPDRLQGVIREHRMVVEGRDEVITPRPGVPPGGRHVDLVSAEVEHQGVPSPFMSVVLVEEG